ncbi:MAG TPA: SAM-dependent methyltransferase [Desulfobacteraceae bacterium]|nr:SAM-dependent methyltransferase [Desulfobacteraceae bacterium]|tara:strand:+ start:794 stop:1576 length:783 start_codon:yes stop_codon:yes gene_type:complete
METDRNFDDLAPKFRRKVYGGLKGEIRLAVLEKDLGEFFPRATAQACDRPLRVLDAGGGYGPFSLGLANRGHLITLCDISSQMLDIAGERFEKEGVGHQLDARHAPILEIASDPEQPFDLILCHAVLGWVAAPEAIIAHLVDLLPAGGILSLTFYNLHGMIYKNLLRTNYKKIITRNYTGYPGSLTPTWPRTPETVMDLLSAHPLDILCHSGIRVFHDYILNLEDQKRTPETVLALELEFSRQMPYRDLGRYQHILARKT